MNKVFVVFTFFFFNIFTINLNAEIAYIDINLILKKSEVGKSLHVYVKNLNKEYFDKYKKIEQELIKKENSLLAKKNILEKDEYEKKKMELSNEIKKFRINKKLSKDKLNQLKMKNTNKILKILDPIISKYVETNSIALVFPKKNIIVGKKDLDITAKIIKLLNIQVKEINF